MYAYSQLQYAHNKHSDILAVAEQAGKPHKEKYV